MSDDSQKCAPIFGAGQKNNPSHGPVAQVTMAPLSIYKYFNTYQYIILLFVKKFFMKPSFFKVLFCLFYSLVLCKK